MKPEVIFSYLCFKYSVLTLRIMTLSGVEIQMPEDWDTDQERQIRGHILTIFRR